MTGVAMLSRELSDRRRLPRDASRLQEWLAQDMVAITLSALAIGELVADKLPGIPDRIAPGPLFGRALIGGVVGAAVADSDQRALGAVVGALAAVTAAWLAWFTRREVQRVTFLPDAALALAEDAMAITAAREIVEDL
jgi:uncharacterized membrane protein